MSGLLSDIWEGSKEFFGGLLDVDPELQARRDAEAKALYDSRAESPFFQMLGWGEGNDERSSTNPIVNFLPNVGSIYRDTATMATNPAVSAEAVSNLVAGGVLNLTPVGSLLGEDVGQAQREMANEFGHMVKDTFGSWENLKTAAIRNPADVLGMMVGTGFAVKGVADVVTNPAVQAKFVEQLQNMADPTESLFPRIKKATGGLIDLDPRMYAMMHHSSPAQFDRFRTRYMGSGEGAQMYGWGIYHADNRDVTLSQQPRDLKYEAKIQKLYNEANNKGDTLAAEMYLDALNHDAPEMHLPDMLLNYKDMPETHERIKKLHADWQGVYKDADFGDYRVYVPDSAIDTMLHDELPLWKQPKQVQDFLKKENGAYMDLVYKYQPLHNQRVQLEEKLYELNAEKELMDMLGEGSNEVRQVEKQLEQVMTEQFKLKEEMKVVSRGDVPDPEDGSGIYGWLVSKEIAENGIPKEALNLDRPQSAVEEIISKRLDANNVLGRKYADEYTRERLKQGDSDFDKTYNLVTFNENTSKPVSNKGEPIGKASNILLPTGTNVNLGFAGTKGDRRVSETNALEQGLLDPYGHTIRSIPDRDDIITSPNLSIFDQEGKTFIVGAGDLTRGGGFLTDVDGVPLRSPVELLAGEDYMWLPESVKRNLVWASEESQIDKLIKNADAVAERYDIDPIFINMHMKPTGGDFSHQIADTMIQSALSRLSPLQIDELNDTIRKESFVQPKGKKGEPPPPRKMIGENFRGVDVRDPLGKDVSGDLRKEIIRLIDRDYRMNGGQKLKGTNLDGALSATQARIANAKQGLLDAEPLTLGNIATIDMKNPKADYSGHRTYNTGLRGQAQGTIKENVHILDLFDTNKADKKTPITFDNISANDYRKLTMQPIGGKITSEKLDRLKKRLEETGGII